jgi:hypothetical protein
MVRSCVFFAVRTELLNVIQTSFGFQGLNMRQNIGAFTETAHASNITGSSKLLTNTEYESHSLDAAFPTRIGFI